MPFSTARRALIKDNAVDFPDDPRNSPDAGADWDSNGIVDFMSSVEAVANLGSPPVMVPAAGFFGTLSPSAGVELFSRRPPRHPHRPAFGNGRRLDDPLDRARITVGARES